MVSKYDTMILIKAAPPRTAAPDGGTKMATEIHVYIDREWRAYPCIGDAALDLADATHEPIARRVDLMAMTIEDCSDELWAAIMKRDAGLAEFVGAAA